MPVEVEGKNFPMGSYRMETPPRSIPRVLKEFWHARESENTRIIVDKMPNGSVECLFKNITAKISSVGHADCGKECPYLYELEKCERVSDKEWSKMDTPPLLNRVRGTAHWRAANRRTQEGWCIPKRNYMQLGGV